LIVVGVFLLAIVVDHIMNDVLAIHVHVFQHTL
jgi:hypothetical protein